MPIIIASNNKAKAQELKTLLEAEHFTTLLQAHLTIGQAAETGLTFVENAILKARYACEHTKMPAIADDSGLEVDALAHQPGVYSARYAGANATDKENMAKLLWELREIPATQRTARFQCVIVLLRSVTDPTPIICQGTWEGQITTAPVGDNGFGYDPIFWVASYQCTAAQIAPTIKNRISHRAQAIQHLITALKRVKTDDL